MENQLKYLLKCSHEGFLYGLFFFIINLDEGPYGLSDCQMQIVRWTLV